MDKSELLPKAKDVANSLIRESDGECFKLNVLTGDRSQIENDLPVYLALNEYEFVIIPLGGKSLSKTFTSEKPVKVCSVGGTEDLLIYQFTKGHICMNITSDPAEYDGTGVEFGILNGARYEPAVVIIW